MLRKVRAVDGFEAVKDWAEIGFVFRGLFPTSSDREHDDGLDAGLADPLRRGELGKIATGVIGLFSSRYARRLPSGLRSRSRRRRWKQGAKSREKNAKPHGENSPLE